MLNSIRTGLQDLAEWLDWAPDKLVALILLALTIAIALVLHGWLSRVADEIFGRRFTYVRVLVRRTRGVTRLALLILALIIAVPAAPLDPETKTLIAKAMAIGIIALIGWASLTAIKLAAEFYLLRYRIDVDDNLLARKHVTQVRVLMRVIDTMVVLITVAVALMSFESVRQYGVSLFASAGVAGIVAGLAARPVLSNLFAGVQLAITQPIRIDDAVIVEGEWGNVEEITSTYVVVKLWDLRRMVLPLTYFIEKPFQNWTREGANLIGSILLYLDYSAPIDVIRSKAEEFTKGSPLWDGKVTSVQVTDCKDRTLEVRVLVSANTAGAVFDLRCAVREMLIDFLQREYPHALPRQRNETVFVAKDAQSIPLAPDGGERKRRETAR